MKNISRFIALSFVLVAFVTPAFAGPSAQELYEKAVAAYENENLLKALDLVNQTIKIAPDNKQALKLKLVIEGELHPTDVTAANGDGSSLWTYCQGDNLLESDPEYLHVAQVAEGPVTNPSYATMALTLPAHVTEYDAIFKLKFGDVGGLPSGVAILQKEKPLLFLGKDQSGLQFFSGKTSQTHSMDSSWHEYHIHWRTGNLEVTCDGRQIFSEASQEVPDLLQFGGQVGKSGRQTEAFLQWIGLDYNVPKT